MEPVAVVIPTLNEASTIGAVIAEIPRTFAANIIVADSGSTDDTRAVARSAGARVIEVGQGYGRACAAGAAVAHPSSEIIAFLDGDGADRGDLMAKIVGPILDGSHDFVLASRTRGDRDPGAMLWHQLFVGFAAGWAISALYGTRYSDMCAYRAIRRDALNCLGMRELTYGWNIEMQMRAAQQGLRILEVPLPYRCRAGGQSKVAGSVRGTIRAGGRIIWTFSRVALASNLQATNAGRFVCSP